MLIIPSVILAITSDEDREYMENLYREHCDLMLSVARTYCDDPNEIEDIVSDSCIKLIDTLENIRRMDDDYLERYIFVVVRNTAFDHDRKRTRLNEHFFHISEERVEQLSNANDVEKRVMLKAEVEYVLEIIKSLPPKEQLVLLLKFSMGLSDAEIAESVGLAPSSVRKYVERARARIKERYYR